MVGSGCVARKRPCFSSTAPNPFPGRWVLAAISSLSLPDGFSHFPRLWSLAQLMALWYDLNLTNLPQIPMLAEVVPKCGVFIRRVLGEASGTWGM